ncbi:12547_t:CDS:2 [Acaulospora morrowiae]|uniref:12547_t:CDS:1 n=1 Tax=Acaulospora morrowiae TaxID=94023 RepID=A0A9N9HFG4_9GLOM|nr:12547_t:CDS:2 [Acaulospora morrowiae]
MEDKETSPFSFSFRNFTSDSVASSSNALPNLGPSFDRETTEFGMGRNLPQSNVVNGITLNNATESSREPLPFIPNYLRNTPIDLNNRALGRSIIPLPSKWNRYDAGRDLRVRENELADNDDATAIRTDHPIPIVSGIYYFEIDIIFGGKTQNWNWNKEVWTYLNARRVIFQKMTGWDRYSFGYHGDDGRTFHNGHRWETDPYGPLYSTGDTIGCCVDFFNRSIFYTKNGINLGEVNILRGGYLGINLGGVNFLQESFEFMKYDLYPVIGMKNEPVYVEANFGTRPFKFDIDYYAKKRFKEVGRDQLSHIASGLYPVDDYLSLLCQEFRLKNLEF